MKVAGVTGRIGSGKSTLCRILSERHAVPVIDADALGHEALDAIPEVRQALVSRFGAAIADRAGVIDRARLGVLVFSDPAALRDLNAIVHPWIIRRTLDRLAALRGSQAADIVLVDAALLLTWKALLPLDRIVVVRCTDAVCVQRLRLRGISEEEAQRRLANQAPESDLLRYADHVVDNNGSKDDLRKAAEGLWESLHRTRKDGTR